MYHYPQAWKERDPTASRAGIKKLDLHTYFLHGRNIIMVLASDNIDDKTKESMVEALLQHPQEPVPMGKPVAPRVYDDSTLPDFVTSESWHFFRISSIKINRRKWNE